MSINNFIYGDQFAPKQQPTTIIPQNIQSKEALIMENRAKGAKTMNDVIMPDLEKKEVVVDLSYIINETPKPKVVREFFRQLLSTIKSEEEEMFGGLVTV